MDATTVTVPPPVTVTPMDVETTKTLPKTLPIKNKAMQCGIVGFVKLMEQDGVLSSELSETLLSKLPLFETIEQQIEYYDGKYDIKHIEQTFIKPRIAEHKKSLKPVKPKKERKPKEAKPKVVKPEVMPETKPEVMPEVTDTEVSTEVSSVEAVERPSTPELPKVATEPTKPVKKPRVRKTDGEKKPRGRKVKETEVVFSRDEDESKPVNLVEDLKMEEYVETKPVEDTKPKKTKTVTKKVTKEKKQDTPKEEDNKWMIMRENVRYWTTDEFEKNGLVYENTLNSEGDSVPGVQVGILDNGILKLF
jgi:hypothetical protein